MTTSPTHALLERLDHVIEIRAQQWRAKCPCHEGRSRDSLSIAETSDGTVLIRCWGGCTAKEVVESIGLDLKDLFPPRELSQAERRDYARSAERREIRLALRHELLVLQQCNDAHIEGWPIIDPDPEGRARLAVTRIRHGLEVLYA